MDSSPFEKLARDEPAPYVEPAPGVRINMINLSLKAGKFASSWIIAKVLPGQKNKGSKFDAKFYMPLISNFSKVSKLVEMAAMIKFMII